MTPEELLGLLTETERFWRGWLARSTYRGRWREMVDRWAITLKLMTYAPTGAPVAAPTTGLPELVGGERNWDYRFTWVRDGSFSVHALLGLGFTDEAAAFIRWLGDRVAEQAGQESGPLKIIYRVDGSADLGEQTLDHLEGYQRSRPVRGAGRLTSPAQESAGAATPCGWRPVRSRRAARRQPSRRAGRRAVRRCGRRGGH